MASEKRASAFRNATVKPQTIKSAKWQARKSQLRTDGIRPSIFVYNSPGRGQNGESAN
jgi:hypothetical protein